MDAIRRLNSRHEIEFLLTAYVETLQFFGVAKHLPPSVVMLPLRGIKDIESRCAELSCCDAFGLQHAHRDSPSAISLEAAEIFGGACVRLHALQSQPHPTYGSFGQGLPL